MEEILSVPSTVECQAIVANSASVSTSTKPRLPDRFNKLLTKPRLKATKQFIGSFRYRHNDQTNFNAHKLRPLSRIMDTARMIIYAPQPIKCVEAVFLALYLTAGLPDVDRIPLGFKTQLDGQVYQHIVLLVQHGARYGAFGISRCPDLMSKDLIFDRMSDIIENFKFAYEDQHHKVLKIRLGLPVEHNIVSPNFVCWRHLTLNLRYQSWSQCVDAVEKHSTKMKRLWDLWILSGNGEDPQKQRTTRKVTLDNKIDSAKKKKVIDSWAHKGSGSKTSLENDQTEGVAESSGSKVCSEINVVAPFPGTIGNSKFRKSKTSGSGSRKSEEETSKSNRAVPRSRPRSARNREQTLAVKRSVLKSSGLKGGSTGCTKIANNRPKTSARRTLAVIGRNSLLARIPAHVSFQTLELDRDFVRGNEAFVNRISKRSVGG